MLEYEELYRSTFVVPRPRDDMDLGFGRPADAFLGAGSLPAVMPPGHLQKQIVCHTPRHTHLSKGAHTMVAAAMGGGGIFTAALTESWGLGLI